MNKPPIVKEIIVIIRRYLSKKDFKIFLFGSWARNSAQQTSDIDIAILGKTAVDDMILLRIKDEIAAIPTLRKIDVVDLQRTDKQFREEVLSYAKPI